MASVDTVEIANRQGAVRGQLGVLVAAKNFHGSNYRFYRGTVDNAVMEGDIISFNCCQQFLVY